MAQYAEIEASVAHNSDTRLAVAVKVTSFKKLLWRHSALGSGEVNLVLDSAASTLTVAGGTGAKRVRVLRCLAENQLLPKAGQLLHYAASTGKADVELTDKEAPLVREALESLASKAEMRVPFYWGGDEQEWSDAVEAARKNSF